MPGENATQRVTGAPAPKRARTRRWWPRLARSLRGRGLVRLRSSIGFRLVVLALALGVPFVAYVGGNAAHQASLEREEAKQRTLALAKLFAARVDDYIGDVLSALALIEHGTSFEAGDAGANDAFLQRVRADLPRSLNNVGVWTREGRNVGALNRGSMTADASVADRDFFRRALATGNLAVDAPVVSRGNGEPVVVFARPVKRERGEVIGVVTVSARLRDLGWLVDLKGAAPPDTVVSIVNADGIVLMRSIEPERWIGMDVRTVGHARDHLAMADGVDETRGADGIARIAGFTHASRLPWHVFVGMPADVALASVRANLRATLALGVASLLLGALFAAYVGTHIARPLRRLAYDAARLTRGDLAHRTAVAGDDEAGILAGALNRLAATVEERTRALEEKSAALEENTAALERRSAELATITANVPVLIAYVDADERFRFVNEYFREAFGIPPEKVVGRTLRELVGDVVYARLEGRMREVRSGLPQTFETSFVAEGGGPVFMVSCFPDYGDAHEVRGAYVVCQDITRRKDAEEALAARERFVRLVADGIPARITYIDTHDRLLFGNRRFAEYWGHDPADIVGRSLRDLVPPAAFAQIKPELDRSYEGEPRRFDLVVERDGAAQYYQVDHVPDLDATGAVQGVFTISQDVTALREARAQVEASEQRLQRITDNIPSMVGYIDAEGRYRFNSRYYEAWLGRPLSAITGRLVRDVLGSETYATVGPNLERALAGERVDFDVEVKRPDGTRFVRGSYIPDVDASGKVLGVYTSASDVTPQKVVERQLERLAQKDTLTGLPNRHMFNDGIAAALRRSGRSGTQVALLFLDVDGFKKINDTLGHAAGDEVLREFARRLTASVRATDLVARLAGDEFVIVLEGIHNRDECRFVARKIIAAMRPDFHAGGLTVKVTTSIGIALGRGGTTTPEALLKRADSALYAAKGHGRDTFEIAI
jgi:diguanylate cyclase (GGDEF)-like protein/PAS domain S-box-containing protein